MEARTEAVDATAARARLGDIVARARYGGWRFIIRQRGEAAAVVMGYDDYHALTELLEDLEDVRDILETEGEATWLLREYLVERARWGAC
jgi:prevent-host-death family protein